MQSNNDNPITDAVMSEPLLPAETVRHASSPMRSKELPVNSITPSQQSFPHWLRALGRLTLLLSVCLSSTAADTIAEDWPEFRGPQGNGHAPHANIPLTWSETENIRWKIAVPGEGHSSPVIANGQLWLTTALVEPLTEAEIEAKLAKLTTNPNGIQFGGRLVLKALAYDVATGELIHDVVCFEYPETNPKHATNSYASPTPVLREGKLFAHFGEYGTCCLETATGKILWANDELKIDHQNGPGSTPVVWQDKVIVHFDGTDQQFLVAYQADTGDIAWKQMRSGEMHDRPEFKKAYGTPTLLEVNGQMQVISPAANWVYAYDPATGAELWKANYGTLGFSTVPKPVIGHGMAFICTSYIKSRLLAVRYDGVGDVTPSHVVWHTDRQVPQKPSLLLLDSELYFTSDGGIATCLDALTGQQHWQERFRGQYSASPLYASNCIYFFNQEGITTVIRPGRELEQVAENVLDAGCMASPAILDNALFLRTRTHLYRIEQQPHNSTK